MRVAAGDAAPTLVLLAPLRVEARALRRGARDARVVRTGMGPRRARRAARRLLGAPAGALAVAGLCGSLDPELPPGTTVVADSIRGPEGVQGLPEAPAVAEALAARGVATRRVPLVSAEHLVWGAARRALRETGALAVDMESAWLAEASGERRFAVVRTVLDAPGRGLLRAPLLGDLRRALLALEKLVPALEAWART